MKRKPPDFDLWTEVAGTVTPLRRRGTRKSAVLAPSLQSAKPGQRISAPHGQVPRSRAELPPPIGAIDRRTSQKLMRGNVEINRRIDLHGTGTGMARMQLLAFLRDAHAGGLRTVLVITGKGDSPFARHTLHGAGHFHAPERLGRLRRLVPEWLHEAEFRALVSGFQPAHPKHGGGGAFYVRIPRPPCTIVTPFGEKMRELRRVRGVTLKDMAQAIGVSPAYLSALEHGKRGRPGWHLIQRIIAYFNIIWDDAEDVVSLARISHPRIAIDTSGLSSKATELANRLADDVSRLDGKALDGLIAILDRRGRKFTG